MLPEFEGLDHREAHRIVGQGWAEGLAMVHGILLW